MKFPNIANEELNLNIKNQIIEIKEVTTVGYEFEKGIWIFSLMFPKGLFKNIRGEKLK